LTSASPRCLDVGDVDLLHRHHRLEGTHCLPRAAKWARDQAVSPQVESSNVYLPHPAIAPWVEAFVEECSTFPNGKYDDQVDRMTQVLNRLRAATSPAKKPAYQPPRQSSDDRSCHK
jgi:phage terminase large subunit-like protein